MSNTTNKPTTANNIKSLSLSSKPPVRCGWCGTDELYCQYHDEEWGVPVYDDQKMFEFLILEGAQAGLSWITVLRKREAYRKAFDHFDPVKIARYSEAKKAKLLLNPGIIRNRLKIESVVRNARAFLDLQEQGESFSDFLWQFVDGKPKQNRRRTLADIPASTPESDAMSKALKKRGFNFVGTTICYAHMQATGMVNDHLMSCHRYKDCAG
ncbi:DNA-3-methyladenine glycosylase I [Cellvibrio sp. ARAG 10.3]|uniref:DNA-3-methyladenine glycosylase I n=1 Tax=Cellvibrio sp. ARAG 10.3 TaxID=3451358 RepID=UPI003F459A5C